jgi:hypothetical protein
MKKTYFHITMQGCFTTLIHLTVSSQVAGQEGTGSRKRSTEEAFHWCIWAAESSKGHE